MKREIRVALPADFLWGTASSAYQIEGAANLDGRGPSIWDTFCRQPGRVLDNANGDIACDQYHRYRDDIALMKDLGIQAYRFSIAWPRVLPLGRGQINEPGLDYYARVVDALLAAGIEPWICLYHWDLPQALAELGGWTVRDSAGWFADYAALIARRLGDRVSRFATFNEPSISALFGYLFGTNAPGHTSVSDYLRVVHHLNLAHGRATQALRQTQPNIQVGAIYTLQPVRPSSTGPADQQAARTLDSHWNGVFAEPQQLGYYPATTEALFEPLIQPGDLAQICQPQQWLGINHYSPLYAAATEQRCIAQECIAQECIAQESLGFTLGEVPADIEQSAIGWPIDPTAFRDTLISIAQKYRLPLYVTENGYGGYDEPEPDGSINDVKRIDYLERYTRAVADAVTAGADVRGYFVWTLLDNFEWAFGYRNRFGIVHVDFATQRRTIKASGHWYRALIERHRD